MNIERILFEMSHKDRMRILYHLGKGPARLTDISRALGINTVEASRHLSRLTEVGLLTKRSDNNYVPTNMTPFLLLLYERMKFIVDNMDFFLSHDLPSYPPLIENVGALAKAERVDGFFNVVTLIKDISESAEDYLYVFSPTPMKDVASINAEKSRKGVDVRIIYSEGSEVPSEYHGSGVKVRFNNAFPCALKFSEKTGGLALCNSDGTVDFSSVLTGDDDIFLSYLKALFERLWSESKP